MRFLRSAGRLHLESMNFANAIVSSPPIGSQIRLINVVAGETALPGWGERSRTRKCRFFEISAELLAFPEHFGTRDFSWGRRFVKRHFRVRVLSPQPCSRSLRCVERSRQ